MKENMKVRGQLKWYLAWPLLLSLFLMFANVAVLLVSWQAACMMLPFTITYIAMSAVAESLQPQAGTGRSGGAFPPNMPGFRSSC